MTLLAVLVIALCYLPVHAYHIYADNRKFSQTKAAMDGVYNDIVQNLGQPDNVKAPSSCSKVSGDLRSHNTCTVETDFIYGISTTAQANILLKEIQKTLAASKLFKPAGKVSSSITSTLVFDTYYHDALDNYIGPHHIDCSVKYSYNTPNEVDLSLTHPHEKPFEVFFACSAKTNHTVYPTS